MKPGGGKQKGASFERDTCKKLSQWISGGARDDLLWRSAMSGGRATVMNRKGGNNKSQIGDISAVDALAAPFIDRFVLECKHYGDLGLLPGILKTKGTLCEFWAKVAEEAYNNGKQPVLIAKQDMWPTMFITSPEAVRILKPLDFVTPQAWLPQWTAYIFRFDDLLTKPYGLY